MEDRPLPPPPRRKKRRRGWRHQMPRFLLTLTVGGLLAFFLGQLRPVLIATAETRPAQLRSAEAREEATVPSRGTPERMQALQAELRRRVAEAPARVAAVYVQDLLTGNTAAANPNREFLAASLIKLPVMAAVYEVWEKQPEKKTRTALTWMEWMITVSDNASTDRLITVAGGAEDVVDFCAQRGWPNFRVTHGIYAHRQRKGPNICTAREVTEFLAALDQRKLVSPAADEEMWQVMCRSKKLLRIPAGVPKLPGVLVGNKSGTLSNVLHDSAIVHTPNARYALTVLMSGHRGEYRGNRFCKEISRLVFDTLHGPAETPELITTSGKRNR